MFYLVESAHALRYKFFFVFLDMLATRLFRDGNVDNVSGLVGQYTRIHFNCWMERLSNLLKPKQVKINT